MSRSLDRFRELDTDSLAHAYRELGGIVRAVEAQRLAILGVLMERRAWVEDGAVDAGQWVAATDAVTGAEGRQRAATAERLRDLPALAAAAEEGRLSLAQLGPLTEIADPASDPAWAASGPGHAPAALERLAAQGRRVSREAAERQHRRRSFRWWPDRHGVGVRFAALLPHDDAAIVTRELAARAEAAGPIADGSYEPFDSRVADALVEACSEAAGAANRAEIVVHVPVGIDRAPTLPDGTILSIDVVRRLACDATASLLVENPDGTVAGYGRRRRTVPPNMRRRITLRDGDRCGWAGCDRRRRLQAHHIIEWSPGRGETEEDNCLLLCPVHHHLVHEGGWRITGNPRDGTLRFLRPPWGEPIRHGPNPADDELLHRLGLRAA